MRVRPHSLKLYDGICANTLASYPKQPVSYLAAGFGEEKASQRERHRSAQSSMCNVKWRIWLLGSSESHSPYVIAAHWMAWRIGRSPKNPSGRS